MNIKSIITMEKNVTMEIINEEGFPTTLILAYISANIDRNNGQCIFNLQILDKDNYEKYNYYIYTEILEFMKNLGAYTQGSILEILSGILPNDEEINAQAKAYLNK